MAVPLLSWQIAPSSGAERFAEISPGPQTQRIPFVHLPILVRYDEDGDSVELLSQHLYQVKTAHIGQSCVDNEEFNTQLDRLSKSCPPGCQETRTRL